MLEEEFEVLSEEAVGPWLGVRVCAEVMVGRVDRAVEVIISCHHMYIEVDVIP